jgi:hypothetical protein
MPKDAAIPDRVSFLEIASADWIHNWRVGFWIGSQAYVNFLSRTVRGRIHSSCRHLILDLTLEPIKQNPISHAGGIGRARTLECHEAAVG